MASWTDYGYRDGGFPEVILEKIVGRALTLNSTQLRIRKWAMRIR
jgi:hypothetical protein